AALLEGRAVLAGDQRVTRLPLDLGERIAARNREIAAHAELGLGVLDPVRSGLIGGRHGLDFLLGGRHVWNLPGPLWKLTFGDSGGVCAGPSGPDNLGRGSDGTGGATGPAEAVAGASSCRPWSAVAVAA